MNFEVIMAFCNSCGATLTDGTRFCSKCGAPVAGAPAASATPVPGTVPDAKSSGVKTILIIVGVIMLIGVLGITALSFVAYRFARRSHVTQEGDHVKVETPFGTAETSKDPDEAAKNLGLDIYPGAEAQKEGASISTFGGVRTVSVAFESDDSVAKVCTFYKSKFPNANVSTSGKDRCTIVSNNPRNMITINVEPNDGDGSRFQIANVIRKSNQ
jgi:hypothetical protein